MSFDFDFFSNFFRIFRKLFLRFVRLKNFPEIGRAETICLVQISSNFELSSRFFGCLKIFVGLGSLYSLEPIFQTPHYPKSAESSELTPGNVRPTFQNSPAERLESKQVPAALAGGETFAEKEELKYFPNARRGTD